MIRVNKLLKSFQDSKFGKIYGEFTSWNIKFTDIFDKKCPTNALQPWKILQA